MKDLILVYSQGFESLWKGLYYLMESGVEIKISCFIENVLAKNPEQNQLILASRFMVHFQNSLK